jgi:aminomethyltransferase
MDATTTPLEAGLAWVVKLRKKQFIGRAVLAAQAAEGVARRLVGLQLDEPGIPRHGYAVWRDGTRVGEVTSGTKSPTLGAFIGLAYVTSGVTAPGTPLAVEIRGRRLPARVVDRPFYRRVRREG